MIEFQENIHADGRMEGWTDRQTLFYRTLPTTTDILLATAGDTKSISNEKSGSG